MDNNAIFDKSDKGREEIITRKYKLAPRLRSLLVLIDGKKTAGELLQQVTGLGLDRNSLDELYALEFIEPSSAPQEMVKPHLIDPATTSAPQAEASRTASSKHLPDGLIAAENMLALQSFFNANIKSTLGLRGFTLQLKVERAQTLGDFRALGQQFLEATNKAKGPASAESLRERLDQLLALAEKSLR